MLPLSPSEGAQKCKMAVFCLKVHFSRRKSATKFLCVNTVSDKVVRLSLAYLPVQKRWWTSPSTWNFSKTDPPPSKNASFQLIFTRSTIAVAPSAIHMNRKSAAGFLMSVRCTVYIASKPPKGAQKCKVTFFRLKFEQWSVITSKWEETGCQLVLITNRYGSR